MADWVDGNTMFLPHLKRRKRSGKAENKFTERKLPGKHTYKWNFPLGWRNDRENLSLMLVGRARVVKEVANY